MIHDIRPIRRAAQIAATRISQYAQADLANSDSDEDTPFTMTSIERARKNGYDYPIHIVKYLLDESDKAKTAEHREEIILKIFEVVNNNPKILIHEPAMRDVLSKKVDEFNNNITDRIERFNHAKFDDAIKMMKCAMFVNVKNSSARSKIFTHLNEINIVLNDYKTWADGKPLKHQFDMLNKNILSIQLQPEYVKESSIAVPLA